MRLRDFRLLLAGAATGQLGAQVTLVALPLVAVLELDAPAFQVGLLTAAETAAFLLVGLPAGALTDRMRKRPLMIRTDLLRAAAMASIPAAAVADVLTMAQLYAVALVTGVATVFFDVAHQSYLPQILPRDQLMAGNGALETVRSTAHVTGPGIGGGLVQLVGAQFAVIVDAIGYLLSALFLRRIDQAEKAPEPAAAGVRCARRSVRVSASSSAIRCSGSSPSPPASPTSARPSSWRRRPCISSASSGWRPADSGWCSPRRPWEASWAPCAPGASRQAWDRPGSCSCPSS